MVRATNTPPRQDGLSWLADGYATTFANGQPMHLQIAGEAFTRQIVGFGDIACPYADPFPGCGIGSVMLLGAPAITPSAGAIATSVHVIEPRRVQASAPMNVSVQAAVGAALPTSTLGCATCNFVT